ncbi:DinB family protein [Parvicella tangerina]|uniref:DinB-like domain-containing protein n=1 Tax=Parvicella tangerina TaxID=2829795 RepID=A0A916NDS5_9FLAO|nr:DinB family protein [Parvicella tangerina]CAG5085721.1 hypothetical protein CRYO30217_02853 [Parvicella tangerina]
MITKPTELNTSKYFAGYVNLAKGGALIESLEDACEEALVVYQKVSEEQAEFAYADGKWTVKQLVQHVIDTERVFGYRALSIARGDQQNLCGFEEDAFASNDHASLRSWEDIIREYVIVRESTIALFDSFAEAVLDNAGTANGVGFTPRVLGWVLSGHDTHHLNVLKERYLINF